MNRVKIIFRNSFYSIISQLVIILAGFFSQRVLNLAFGQALIGVNSVISNVIAFLSVSELGVSTAVTYHLYRTVAQHREEESASLMNFYRRFYHTVASFILAFGLVLLPFIHRFMRENPFSIRYVRLLFLLWLIRTALSYPLSYKRSILIANQQDYLCSLITLATNLFYYLSIILCVRLLDNYLLSLGGTILFEILVGLIQNRLIDRMYPFLRTYRRNRSGPELREKLTRDIKDIFLSRLAQKLLNSTDNLILSGMISVILTGAYNNYSMISQSVLSLVRALNRAVQPTLGNLFVENDLSADRRALRQLSFLYFLIASFVTCGLLALSSPFVGDLWLTRDFLLPQAAVSLSAISCGIHILGYPLESCMAVNGMFREERNLTMLSAAVNLIVSLALVLPLQLTGILWGTILANLLMTVMRMVFLFRRYLKASLAQYAAEMLLYHILTIAEALLCGWICGALYSERSFPAFLACCAVCAVLPLCANALLFIRTERFRSLLGMWKLLKR